MLTQFRGNLRKASEHPGVVDINLCGKCCQLASFEKVCLEKAIA